MNKVAATVDDHSNSALINTTSPSKTLSDVRMAVHAALGQVVLAMSSVPRYKSQSLSDLGHLVIDPLIRDRIAIAQSKGDKGDEKAELSPAAIAIWASVSDAVDEKIVEQIKAGVFPVRLKPDEWTSGTHVWLLDVIAPTRELATTVLSNFNQVSKRDKVKIHPLVVKLVDREALKKMQVEPHAASDSEGVLPN